MGSNALTKYILFFLLFVFSSNFSVAQVGDTLLPKIYRVNKLVEIPITLGLVVSHYYGFLYINDKPVLDEKELGQLDYNDIWKFDRWATQQDPSFVDQAAKISDNIMNLTVLLPGFLALDKDIRNDWLDLLVLYGETHAINTSLYILTAVFIDRYRPIVYNEGVPLDDRMVTGTRNSFFSGHTSTTATSFFFAAKVYSDYHPELGNKKYLLYGAALVAPLVVGQYRIKAMRHFPTDVIMGTIVGAATGILVPHFHKIRKGENGFSVIPFFGDMNGMTIRYAFR